MLRCMRTTVVIDDDILKQIERITRREGRTRRDVLNDILRKGIQAADQQSETKKTFETRSLNLGRCLLPSIDRIADVIAVAEGEAFK